MNKLIVVFVAVLATLMLTESSFGGGLARFSWLPNTEAILTGYEVYCGKQSLAGGGQMEIQKPAAKDNIVDGRVRLDWPDFPAGKQYCVAVALGESGLVSGYSEEAVVEMGMAPPGGFQAVIVNVTVHVSK